MDKLNVLLVTGLLTAEHQGRKITQRLRDLMEATGRFHVAIVEEFRNITPAFLEPYDVLFVDYDGKTGRPTTPAASVNRQSLPSTILLPKEKVSYSIIPQSG